MKGMDRKAWRRLLPAFFFVAFFCMGSVAAVIPVSKFRSPDMPGGAPPGWAVEQKIGTPSLRMEQDGAKYYIRLMSGGNSSFGVRTSARINVRDFPIVSWRWRVDKLPVGGDVRRKAADDQALQVYVAFKETRFPAVLNTPVIGYIWDNEAPKGWSGRSTQVGGDKMRYIVLRNKTDRTGQWYTERRNIYEDYKRLFGDINGGEPLGVTTGLQIHINTQRTKTPAEGMIGDIFFSNELKEVVVAEVPREKISARTPGISAPKRKPVSRLDGILEERKFSNTGCVNIRVEFETNSIVISRTLDEKIQPLLEYLVKYPRARVTITGHADNVGSDAYNMALSERRARAARDYLVEKFSIDAGRLMVRGVGAAEPVASNDTTEGQAQNRCVVIQGCPEENNDHLNKE